MGDALGAVREPVAVQPDVVLLDLELPGRNGLTAVGDVRVAAPGVQIVLITAHADEPGLAARAASRGVPVLDKRAISGTVIDLTDRLHAVPGHQRELLPGP